MKIIADDILSFTDEKEFVEYIKTHSKTYNRYVVSHQPKGKVEVTGVYSVKQEFMEIEEKFILQPYNEK